MTSAATRLLGKAGLADPAERSAVAWSFGYFFCVLCSYYIIRPLRDEMGVTVGKDNLTHLFTIVFFVMLAAVPVFGWVVARFEKRRIVPVVYAFFIANLALFWIAFSSAERGGVIAGAFFVWVSVFNLFVVSLFWSFMADVYSTGQAKRLYGYIAAGGSAGAIAGPLLTQGLVHKVGATNMLWLSAGSLALALVCVAGLSRAALAMPERALSKKAGRAPDHGLIAGATHVLSSPFLSKIALWVLIANLVSTYFYFEQATIVEAAVPSRTDRVQLFARMDLIVSLLAVLSQVLLTQSAIRRIGIGASAASVALLALAGLVALAISPTLAVIVTVIVAERAIGFGLANPAARVLYTVVAPEDKYKAQNFIDTVVYRGGDAASGWLLNGLTKGFGLSALSVTLFVLPFAALWAGLSFVLGREQEARERSSPAPQRY